MIDPVLICNCATQHMKLACTENSNIFQELELNVSFLIFTGVSILNVWWFESCGGVGVGAAAAPEVFASGYCKYMKHSVP